MVNHCQDLEILNAKLLIVGLAPAAHGGNRTGRMFTGDSSGDWLFKVMHKYGFASIPTSQTIDDGLVLKNAYITAAVRCAPPQNKPTREEMDTCFGLFRARKRNSKKYYNYSCVLEKLHMMQHVNYTKLNQKNLDITNYFPMTDSKF